MCGVNLRQPSRKKGYLTRIVYCFDCCRKSGRANYCLFKELIKLFNCSYTAVAVMNGKYRNQIDKELKTGLVGAISGVEDGLKSNSDQISPLVQICGSLSSIVAEPWEYGAFWDFAGSTGELTLQCEWFNSQNIAN